MEFEDKDNAYFKMAKTALAEIKAIIICPCHCYIYNNIKSLDGDVNELLINYVKEHHPEYDDYKLLVSKAESILFRAGNNKRCPFCGVILD